MSAGTRGKYAEGKVRDFLKGWAETHIAFAFNRILDAHSARGAMSNPQPGDYQWFLDLSHTITWPVEPKVGTPGFSEKSVRLTRNGLIEVKEVEHTHLLPYKNYSVDQVGRMRVRELAGSEPLVLVCHRTAKGTLWRAPDFDEFLLRDPTRGSWDLSEVESCKDVGLILKAYLE